jgi:hypothetical protein
VTLDECTANIGEEVRYQPAGHARGSGVEYGHIVRTNGAFAMVKYMPGGVKATYPPDLKLVRG